MKYYFNHVLRASAFPGAWWGLENIVVEEMPIRGRTDFIDVKVVDERIRGTVIFPAFPSELTSITPYKPTCPMK